jgi:hypothetical protein
MKHTSFKLKKDIVSKMHLSRYVANRKIILCCGTQEGKIYIYEIEWDETDPDYAKQAHTYNPHDHQYHKLLLPRFDFLTNVPKMFKQK